MHPPLHEGSISVFNDMPTLTTVPHHVDTSAAVLVLSSLAFLLPAHNAWRNGRLWHAWVFWTLALLGFARQICAIDHPTMCPISMRMSLNSSYNTWTTFCVLQMAFLVLGPEDPQLQLVDCKQTACDGNRPAPWDVLVLARGVPFTVLSAFVAVSASLSSEASQWWSVLLSELLLLVCTGSFWTYRSYKGHSTEPLLRLKFWNRLLNHGVAPAVMLFCAYCFIGLSEHKASRALWHVLQAAFADTALRNAHPEAAGYDGNEIHDLSSHNPNVAHVLLGSTALVTIPTAIVGASYDWCSTSAHWPTISSARSCAAGGYFVAAVAVPIFVATSVVFAIISSTTVTKSRWLPFTTTAWDDQYNPQHDELDLEQRTLGKQLGCRIGHIGSTFGLLSALIFKGTAVRDTLSTLCGFISLGALATAMMLTVLSWDSHNRGWHFRKVFTSLICLPVLCLNCLLTLLEKCLPPDYAFPLLTYTISEYAAVVLVALWPLTWMEEVQEEGQRKATSAFKWPITSWRFGHTEQL